MHCARRRGGSGRLRRRWRTHARRSSPVVLVAYHSLDPSGRRLIDEPVLNATIVLVIATSVVGLVLVDRYADLVILG